MWGTRCLVDQLPDLCRFIPTHVGNTSLEQSGSCGSPVHPHACGEHFELWVRHGYLSGSSPRMWGTPCIPLRHCSRLRFIPTHVGNTSGSLHFGQVTSVHPHACGEHICKIFRPCPFSGSSPRMWGTLFELTGYLGHRRFIPTHVGNTASLPYLLLSLSVHPHACGEHSPEPETLDEETGSSPRMWGTLSVPCQTLTRSRFIPTHVGNTS